MSSGRVSQLLPDYVADSWGLFLLRVLDFGTVISQFINAPN